MTISDEIKILIKEKAKEGYTKQDIALLYNVSERSVYKIISENKKTIGVGVREKNKKVNESSIKRAYSAVKRKNLLVTATRVSRFASSSLSLNSIRRYLKNLKYKYKCLVRRIILTKTQKSKRIEIVRK